MKQVTTACNKINKNKIKIQPRHFGTFHFIFDLVLVWADLRFCSRIEEEGMGVVAQAFNPTTQEEEAGLDAKNTSLTSKGIRESLF